jgi:Dolichyl-phosphate-mannose-protein mannosyltransferase
VNQNHRRRWVAVARVGLFLVAWALLLFRLNDVPPGFQHDQTFTSLDALDVLRGHFPIYFPANFGREPLFMYSVAGVFGVTGGHFVWSLRFAAVLWGMLGLATTLVLARRYLTEGAALVAAALMATSFWFLMAARLGLEPIALLPLSMAFLYLLNRGLARPSLPSLTMAGLAGGLAVYTYLAARPLYLVIPLLLIYEVVVWLRLRRSSRGPTHEETRRLIGLLLALAVMLAVSGPLLVYLQTKPQVADGRVRELGGPLAAALRGDLRPILANAFDTIRSILWAGSRALPYHYNIPGRVVLQPILAIFFVVGLIVSALRVRERQEYLLLGALLLGIAPNLLTGADALFMRAIYALPLLFILVARGLWASGSQVGRVFSTASPGPPTLARAGRSSGPWRVLPMLAGVMLAGLLIWHAVDNGTGYFLRWADAEPTQRIYNADFRAAARYLDEHPAGGDVFIGTDRLLDLDSLTFGLYLADLTNGAELRSARLRQPERTDVNWFSLPESPALPREGTALYLMPAPAEAPASLRFVSEAGAEQFELLGPGGQYELLRGFRVGADAVQRALDASGVRPADEPVTFGGALRLEGLGYSAGPSQDELITQWTVLAPWPRSARPGYLLPRPKVALSLVDNTGYKWSQADVITSLPALTWRPGQMLVEGIPFSIPADLPPGDYGVQLAMYDDEGGPLPVRTAAGNTVTASPAVGQVRIPAANRGEPPSPPFEVRQTRAGSDLRPLGSWESPEKLIAWIPADLHVSWKAIQRLETGDLRFRLRATAEDGSLLWEQSAEPLTPLPGVWPAGQVYRLTHRLQPGMPRTGAASALLELCAELANAPPACAVVGQPTVVSRNPVFELAVSPQQSTDARWGDTLTLVGYDLARASQAITLTLYWRTEAAPGTPPKRFVHAVNAGGEIIGQSDALLENEGIPATYWRPGEYVVDRVALNIPASAQVSDLYVGLYDPQTGERVPVYASSGTPMLEGRMTIELDLESP